MDDYSITEKLSRKNKRLNPRYAVVFIAQYDMSVSCETKQHSDCSVVFTANGLPEKKAMMVKKYKAFVSFQGNMPTIV